MDASTHDGAQERGPTDASASDTRRWLRDMGALLALPALWVDHEPGEIATGLLSVLFSVLRLDGAYARFDDPDGGAPLVTWRPSGTAVPVELAAVMDAVRSTAPGIATTPVELDGGAYRVTNVTLALPWETGRVLVSARRSDFPTAMEMHLLRVAMSQAAIAIHTARRLGREHEARVAAQDMLLRQHELLRSLVDAAEPSLASLSRHVHEASLLVSEVDGWNATRLQAGAAGEPQETEEAKGARPARLPLTRRELEVLGLLAQGLSNKEIAAVLWLSDRTVERHITSLYRKIGVARRSEATAFALRNGVV
jgi:DNA-binding NarL/FixJ family response regulator